jgi:uroporphyrinogen-III synthase
MKRLQGKTVLITREEKFADALRRELTAHGAQVLHWPTVVIEDSAEPMKLAAAAAALDSYDWIAFTSTNAVAALAASTAPPQRARVAVIGAATAEVLRTAGWRVDLTSPAADARSLAHAMIEAGARAGAKVLFPASAVALETLPKTLRAAGALVSRIEAYRPAPVGLQPEWQARFRAAPPDAAIFTSPSALEGLKVALGRTLFAEFASGVPAVAIGGTTAGALEAQGFARVRIAEDTSASALAFAAAEMLSPLGDEAP